MKKLFDLPKNLPSEIWAFGPHRVKFTVNYEYSNNSGVSIYIWDHGWQLFFGWYIQSRTDQEKKDAIAEGRKQMQEMMVMFLDGYIASGPS